MHVGEEGRGGEFSVTCQHDFFLKVHLNRGQFRISPISNGTSTFSSWSGFWFCIDSPQSSVFSYFFWSILEHADKIAGELDASLKRETGGYRELRLARFARSRYFVFTCCNGNTSISSSTRKRKYFDSCTQPRKIGKGEHHALLTIKENSNVTGVLQKDDSFNHNTKLSLIDHETHRASQRTTRRVNIFSLWNYNVVEFLLISFALYYGFCYRVRIHTCLDLWKLVSCFCPRARFAGFFFFLCIEK